MAQLDLDRVHTNKQLSLAERAKKLYWISLKENRPSNLRVDGSGKLVRGVLRKSKVESRYSFPCRATLSKMTECPTESFGRSEVKQSRRVGEASRGDGVGCGSDESLGILVARGSDASLRNFKQRVWKERNTPRFLYRRISDGNYFLACVWGNSESETLSQQRGSSTTSDHVNIHIKYTVLHRVTSKHEVDTSKTNEGCCWRVVVNCSVSPWIALRWIFTSIVYHILDGIHSCKLSNFYVKQCVEDGTIKDT